MMTAFEIGKSETFWKIILDQTVGIHSNNLDGKVLSYKIKFKLQVRSWVQKFPA